MHASILNRRQILRGVLSTSALPLFPRFCFPLFGKDERTAWYREAKFGMFIHWGPYSVASVEASWPIMNPTPEGITESEYVSLPGRFNPASFDADAWIDLARSAGQKYMVFTTKHHDGFCMFDSSFTDYKITKTPYGKDIVKHLATACDARSMPLGFYYSPPDLHHPDFRDTSKPVSQTWHGNPERPEWPGYLEYMQLQLTELLTHYGPVALIWFDGLDHQEKYDGSRSMNLIHQLQPGTLVNDRIGVPGDYVTPEQFIPTAIPIKQAHFSAVDQSVNKQLKPGVPKPEDFQLWETCMTINDTWAYNKNNHNYKSAQDLIRALVEVASRGGNLLLNVGPQPDGAIQPEFRERLQAMGEWLAVNGESIYGTTYGPIQGIDGIRTTGKGNTVFMHVYDWSAAGLPLAGLNRRVASAHLLATGQKLKFQQRETGVLLEVPAQAPDANCTVIALRML